MRCPRCHETDVFGLTRKNLPGSVWLVRFRCLGCRQWYWDPRPHRKPARHYGTGRDFVAGQREVALHPYLCDPEDWHANYGCQPPERPMS